MSFIVDATFLRKPRLDQILGQPSLRVLRYTNTMRPEVYQGYVVLLLVITLGKFQVFLWQFSLILQHLLIRYVWNHCDQAEDMV